MLTVKKDESSKTGWRRGSEGAGGRASSLVFLVKGRKEGLAGMKVEFREVSLPSLFSFKVHPRMGKGRRKMTGKVYQVNRRHVSIDFI